MAFQEKVGAVLMLAGIGGTIYGLHENQSQNNQAVIASAQHKVSTAKSERASADQDLLLMLGAAGINVVGGAVLGASTRD